MTASRNADESVGTAAWAVALKVVTNRAVRTSAAVWRRGIDDSSIGFRLARKHWGRGKGAPIHGDRQTVSPSVAGAAAGPSGHQASTSSIRIRLLIRPFDS